MDHQPDWYNISLKVFLKNEKNEILALKADPDGALAGFYEFPGGRISQDEFDTDYSEIIKRELEEELGLEAKFEFNLKPASFARYRAFSKSQNKERRSFWLFFEGKYLGGEIKISAEHCGYAWLDFSKIKLEDYFISGPLEAVRRYLGFHS